MSGAPYPLSYYLGLITSEHNQRENFMATVAAAVQPFVDQQAAIASMAGLFTPNSVGDQLDKIGVWVGANRNLASPIIIDTGGGGGGGGIEVISVLDDADFQTLIKIVIAQNNWDGTVPGAYTIWNSVFQGQLGILIQDNQDMTMLVVIIGTLTTVAAALITSGYFNLRPAGVRITGFFQPSVPGTPVFGFGVENNVIAGWGVGSWIEPLV